MQKGAEFWKNLEGIAKKFCLRCFTEMSVFDVNMQVDSVQPDIFWQFEAIVSFILFLIKNGSF